MAYTVNWTTKVIDVPLSDLTLISGSNYTLDVGDFWIEMRRLEASPSDGLWAEQAIEYVNSQLLSGVNYSSLVKLINGYTWKINSSSINVSLIGPNSNLLDTFIPGSSVSVLANNSAGLQLFPQQALDNIQYLVETQRPHHTGIGKMFYWNPDTGDDGLPGTGLDTAVASFSRAHDLARDGKHDIIVCLSDVAGQTIVDETFEITKNYLLVRGPGRDFRIKPTSTTAPTISINAVGVEISGMVVDTAATGGQSAIEVQDGADFFFVDHVWSRDAQHAAVKVQGSVVYGRIDGCFFSHCVDDGIHIDGDVRHTRITNTEIDAPTGAGIKIEGTTARNNIIGDGVKIYNAGTYGVEIVSPATRNFIDNDVSMYDNASGNILDGGTNTVIESPWNEQVDDHQIAGSFGAKIKFMVNLLRNSL